MVAELILDHAASLGPAQLKRLWLHQANINMNELIARRVLGRDPTREETAIILDEYANTSSAGSMIAFHKHSDDMAADDTGLICSFGAGYSAGRSSSASAEHPRPRGTLDEIGRRSWPARPARRFRRAAFPKEAMLDSNPVDCLAAVGVIPCALLHEMLPRRRRIVKGARS